MPTAEYQKKKREELKLYQASRTPERILMQEEAAELDKRAQTEKDPVKKRALRAEHNSLVNHLAIMAFPPDGITERYRAANIHEPEADESEQDCEGY